MPVIETDRLLKLKKIQMEGYQGDNLLFMKRCMKLGKLL